MAYNFISLIRASLADAQLEHQAGELDDASFAEITEPKHTHQTPALRVNSVAELVCIVDLLVL